MVSNTLDKLRIGKEENDYQKNYPPRGTLPIHNLIYDYTINKINLRVCTVNVLKSSVCVGGEIFDNRENYWTCNHCNISSKGRFNLISHLCDAPHNRIWENLVSLDYKQLLRYLGSREHDS